VNDVNISTRESNPKNHHRPDRSLFAIPPRLGRNLFRRSQHYLDLGVVTSIYFTFVLISRSAAAGSLHSSHTFSAAYGPAYSQRGYGTTRATGTSLTSRDAVKQTESEAKCRQWSYVNVANRRRRYCVNNAELFRNKGTTVSNKWLNFTDSVDNSRINWFVLVCTSFSSPALLTPFRSYIGPRPTVWFSCFVPMSEDVRHCFCCVCLPAVGACPTLFLM
jgi:hypothetical protein